MTKELESLCTVKQACDSEKAGRTTIYKRIHEGHYTAYKIGGSTRISVASLKAYRRRLDPQDGQNVPNNDKTTPVSPATPTGEGAH